MSSFTVASVDVAPAVPLLSDAARTSISDGMYAAGTAAAGVGAAAATAGAAAAAAVALGAGWALFQGGKLVYTEAARVKKESEEREERARILEEQKCETAREERRQILLKSQELKQTWDVYQQTFGDFFQSDQAVQGLYGELQTIESCILRGNSAEMEEENLRDWEHLKQAAMHMEILLMEFSDHVQKKEERAKTVSVLENLHQLMQVISLNRNASGYDVKGRSGEEERIRNCKKEAAEVLAELKYALQRETLRELQIPVEPEDKKYLHCLFDGADRTMTALMSVEISTEQKEAILTDLRKRLMQYQMKKIQLDKKEERFVCLYPVYAEVSKKMGDIPKGPTEFAGLTELESVMESMKKRVRRMEQCAEIYGQIGREAYICMAFDLEMEKLGYKMAERREAQQFVSDQLKNAKTGDKIIPYYSMPDCSLTQFYHFGESTCVQVIVRPDGTTSLETFSVSEKEGMETVIREQRGHCRLNKKLEKALRENWFVCTNLAEVIPPEEVHVKRPKEMKNPTYGYEETKWDSAQASEAAIKLNPDS